MKDRGNVRANVGEHRDDSRRRVYRGNLGYHVWQLVLFHVVIGREESFSKNWGLEVCLGTEFCEQGQLTEVGFELSNPVLGVTL